MNQIKPTEDSFITEKPQDELIRQYISYYYFHRKERGDPTEFLFYPHIKNGLTVYKNSKTIVSHNKASTKPDPNVDYTFLYSGLEMQATYVSITPPFDKIGIAFQPLGINYFVDQSLGDLLSNRNSIQFDYFRQNILPVMEQVYACNDTGKKAQLLDQYFLDQLVGFSEQRLQQAINLLIASAKKFTVEELAKTLAVSRKTLLRLFQRHLNCSVKDFIHIVQFRKAVKQYQISQKKPQLGEVAHNNDYYDQSDFIKRFKKITGFNPKRFFTDIVHVGNEDTFWTFVK